MAGRYVDANGELVRVLGYTLEELRELRIRGVTNGDPTRAQEIWRRFVAGEVGISCDSRSGLRRKDVAIVPNRFYGVGAGPRGAAAVALAARDAWPAATCAAWGIGGGPGGLVHLVNFPGSRPYGHDLLNGHDCLTEVAVLLTEVAVLRLVGGLQGIRIMAPGR